MPLWYNSTSGGCGHEVHTTKRKAHLMKIKHLLWLAMLALCLVLNCCAAPNGRCRDSQAGIRNWQRSLTAPMRESDIPVAPVTRSYTHYSDGSYSYTRNRGTDTYISKWCDPYSRTPRTEFRQNSYDYESKSYTPRYYYPQTYSDPSRGPRPAYVQGYIPLKPQFRP